MRFTIKLIVTIALVFAAEALSFFWLAAFLILSFNMLYRTSAASSLLSGGLGMGIAWGSMGWYLSTGPSAQIQEKVAGILGLTSGTMLWVPVAVGFIIGLISAFAGYSVGKFSQKKPTNIYKA